MAAGGPVFVGDVDVDLLAKPALHVELNARSKAHQIRCDVDLHAVGAHDAVGSEVLALEMHVDRHVKLGAASTNWRDEVDGSDATAFLDEVNSIGRNEQLHDVLSTTRVRSSV